MNQDEQFMLRALELAQKGAGYVAPNPMVGAVIVHQGKIIGEGYHEQFGEGHAEVNAFHSVKESDLLPEATIYVSLEPCSHHGKTPPCCDLIIRKKVKRVVVGCIDPFSEVSGRGIQAIEQAGIIVEVGVLKKECLELNRRFFTFHTKKRPYVILKWAQSADGFMDIDRSQGKKGTHWITQKETKKLTHRWRHEESAILVGRNTVANDNPELNCRAVSGISPHRIVIDPELKLDYGAFHVGDRSVQTFVLTNKEVVSKGKLQFIQPTSFEPQAILSAIYKLGLLSVIVEGGKYTLEQFIDRDLWDEARILSGTTMMEKGTKAPEIDGILQENFDFGKDRVQFIRNKSL